MRTEQIAMTTFLHRVLHSGLGGSCDSRHFPVLPIGQLCSILLCILCDFSHCKFDPVIANVLIITMNRFSALDLSGSVETKMFRPVVSMGHHLHDKSGRAANWLLRNYKQRPDHR